MNRIFNTNPAPNCCTEYVNEFGIHQRQLLMVTIRNFTTNPLLLCVSQVCICHSFVLTVDLHRGQGTFREKKALR